MRKRDYDDDGYDPHHGDASHAKKKNVGDFHLDDEIYAGAHFHVGVDVDGVGVGVDVDIVGVDVGDVGVDVDAGYHHGDRDCVQGIGDGDASHSRDEK